MDENECDFLLFSKRELSSFELNIQTATSKADATEILHSYEVSEEEFVKGFLYLAKMVQGLPDRPLAP